jgi:hypothetical protein
VEGGFENEVLGAQLAQEALFLAGMVDADEFFVEGDGDGRLAAEAGHSVPLAGADGLLDAVDAEGREFAEPGGGFFGGEGAVGVNAELEIGGAEVLAQEAQETNFFVEVDGADLDFYAAEAFAEFLLHTAAHFCVGAHPDESVDGDAGLAEGEGRWKECQMRLATEGGAGGKEGGFEAEEHGGMVAQRFAVEAAALLDAAADGMEECLVMGVVFGGEVVKGGAFAKAVEGMVGWGGQENVPDTVVEIDAARRACGVLEMEQARNDADLDGEVEGELAVVCEGHCFRFVLLFVCVVCVEGSGVLRRRSLSPIPIDLWGEAGGGGIRGAWDIS